MAQAFDVMLGDKGFLLADGATGTNLFALGLEHGDAPEVWNVSYPDRVRTLHRGFVDAGSDLVLTNSFGGNARRLMLHGFDTRVGELNEAAAQLAREVADESGRTVLVAGSMGPTGDLFEPLGPLDHAAGVRIFSEQAQALACGGADLLWLETLSSEDELAAALEAAHTTGLPVVCCLSFDTNGRTMMGMTPASLAEWSHARGPAAFGLNCGAGAADAIAALLEIAANAAPGAVLVAKANCGIPAFVDGQVRYAGTPDLMALYACLARDAGARIIGGCCGTEAHHVARMRAALDAHEPGEPPALDDVVATLGPLTGVRTHGEQAPPASPRTRRRRRSE